MTRLLSSLRQLPLVDGPPRVVNFIQNHEVNRLPARRSYSEPARRWQRLNIKCNYPTVERQFYSERKGGGDPLACTNVLVS